MKKEFLYGLGGFLVATVIYIAIILIVASLPSKLPSKNTNNSRFCVVRYSALVKNYKEIFTHAHIPIIRKNLNSYEEYIFRKAQKYANEHNCIVSFSRLFVPKNIQFYPRDITSYFLNPPRSDKLYYKALSILKKQIKSKN